MFLNCRARAASAWQRRIICGAIRSRWACDARDARDAALEALLQMERRGAWSDGSLKRIAAQSGLEARDAALCTRMTYGVVQNRTLLDYYIDHWCTQKAARLEPVVACLLRLGIYQILFMDKVPDRAAVHETVELTKRRGKARAAGMINAVLRKCASSKNTLPQLPQNSFISKAAVQYSHPRWLVERLTALVGEQEAEAFLRLDNEPVPTVIQANPLKTTPAELENELRSDGVRLVPHPWLEGCFEVTGTGDLERLSAFASGRCTVQDAAARLAAIAAGPKPGDRVLDVCAAPGGKSFAMAMQMENRGDILSCDIHPHKLKLIENGAARLGITIIRTALADGRERHAGWVEQADVVLADVPCSGLGIIRKKPDIRWKDPAQLAQLPARPAVDIEQRVCLRPSRRRAGVCHLHRSAGGKRRRGVGLFGRTPGLCERGIYPARYRKLSR